MKKIIYLLSLMLIISSCAGRKAKSQRSSKKETFKTEQTQQTIIKADSTAKKETKQEQQTSTKTQSQSWKYTAPAVQIRDSVRLIDKYVAKPFWLILNGDSINVSHMPSGASLESRSESSETQSWMQQRIDELIKENKQLEAKSQQKQEANIIEREKIKEVERQSVQWTLVVLALIIGLSLPTILRSIWGYAKAQIPFLSKFTKS